MKNHSQLGPLLDAVQYLITQPDPPKRPIGFIKPQDKPGKPGATKAKAAGKKT